MNGLAESVDTVTERDLVLHSGLEEAWLEPREPGACLECLEGRCAQCNSEYKRMFRKQSLKRCWFQEDGEGR